MYSEQYQGTIATHVYRWGTKAEVYGLFIFQGNVIVFSFIKQLFRDMYCAIEK
jgi:hypothetical protein